MSGTRIPDLPGLGPVTDASDFVGENAGSGRFNALALRSYVLAGGGLLRVQSGDGGIATTANNYLSLSGGTDVTVSGDGRSTLVINGGGRPSYSFEFYANGSRMNAFGGDGSAYKPGGGPWADTSDARIKENVTDYAAGLAEIIQLRPVSYTFRPETGRTNRVQYGLIAQEVETVMPEMVAQVDSDVGNMHYSDLRVLDTQALIYALINAVQELQDRLVTLESAP